LGWDVTAVALLVQCWTMMWKNDAKQTELRAGDEDPAGAAVFVVAIRTSTLVHAFIAFVFNTTIVALALNLIFQLLSG
jgi:uncharacterized membrane protein